MIPFAGSEKPEKRKKKQYTVTSAKDWMKRYLLRRGYREDNGTLSYWSSVEDLRFVASFCIAQIINPNSEHFKEYLGTLVIETVGSRPDYNVHYNIHRDQILVGDLNSRNYMEFQSFVKTRHKLAIEIADSEASKISSVLSGPKNLNLIS